MKGTVVKGYITRFAKEQEWEIELEEANEEDLQAYGDAIPFYIQGEDGKYYEYYPMYLPKDKKVYVRKGSL